MKKQKLSLGSVKNVLSRAEMRNIMAGSGGGCSGCLLDGSLCGDLPPKEQCCGTCYTPFDGDPVCLYSRCI
jgi:hypothetical protein